MYNYLYLQLQYTSRVGRCHAPLFAKDVRQIV